MPRLQELGDKSRPAGLVVSTEAVAIVAVEILVEQQVVTEMGVSLQRFIVAKGGTAAFSIFQEQLVEATR
jgi:hypothetical protein